MSAEQAPHLVALRCLKCSAALDGAPGDRVFLCPACPTAIDLTHKGPVAYPVKFGGSGNGDYQLSWSLEGRVTVKRFAATEPASTPFGTVKPDDTTTLAVRFVVPATASSIGECYRAALASVGERETSTARVSGRGARAGFWGRSEAERVAHQVFLTLVSQAKGEVHFIEFQIAVTACEILARS